MTDKKQRAITMSNLKHGDSSTGNSLHEKHLIRQPALPQDVYSPDEIAYLLDISKKIAYAYAGSSRTPLPSHKRSNGACSSFILDEESLEKLGFIAKDEFARCLVPGACDCKGREAGVKRQKEGEGHPCEKKAECAAFSRRRKTGISKPHFNTQPSSLKSIEHMSTFTEANEEGLCIQCSIEAEKACGRSMIAKAFTFAKHFVKAVLIPLCIIAIVCANVLCDEPFINNVDVAVAEVHLLAVSVGTNV